MTVLQKELKKLVKDWAKEMKGQDCLNYDNSMESCLDQLEGELDPIIRKLLV
jgi:hypothetical protein